VATLCKRDNAIGMVDAIGFQNAGGIAQAERNVTDLKKRNKQDINLEFINVLQYLSLAMCKA
jgi:hypothetical protein